MKIPDLDGIDRRAEQGVIFAESEIKMLTGIIRKLLGRHGSPRPPDLGAVLEPTPLLDAVGATVEGSVATNGTP